MKNLQLNENVHQKLKELSEDRKSKGIYPNTMAAIIAEWTLKAYKKEMKR